MLKQYLKNMGISIYKLSKESGVSYSTLHDIVSGKSDYKNVSIDIFNRLSYSLNVSMDELYSVFNVLNNYTYNDDFDLFKSNICQELKFLGDKSFIKKYLLSNDINKYILEYNYLYALYLVALIDYLSKKNSISLYKGFNDLRKMRLEKIYYPKSIVIEYEILKNNVLVFEYKNAIEEFKKYNIIEKEIEKVA